MQILIRQLQPLISKVQTEIKDAEARICEVEAAGHIATKDRLLLQGLKIQLQLALRELNTIKEQPEVTS